MSLMTNRDAFRIEIFISTMNLIRKVALLNYSNNGGRKEYHSQLLHILHKSRMQLQFLTVVQDWRSRVIVYGQCEETFA